MHFWAYIFVVNHYLINFSAFLKVIGYRLGIFSIIEGMLFEKAKISVCRFYI